MSRIQTTDPPPAGLLAAYRCVIRVGSALDGPARAQLADAHALACGRPGYSAAVARALDAVVGTGRAQPDDLVNVAHIADGAVLDVAVAVLARDLVDRADFDMVTGWWAAAGLPLPVDPRADGATVEEAVAAAVRLEAQLAVRRRAVPPPARRRVKLYHLVSATLTGSALLLFVTAAAAGYDPSAGVAVVVALVVVFVAVAGFRVVRRR